jgi:hypothetical protein
MSIITQGDFAKVWHPRLWVEEEFSNPVAMQKSVPKGATGGVFIISVGI